MDMKDTVVKHIYLNYRNVKDTIYGPIVKLIYLNYQNV